jgi:L-fucose isomerase-like protein
MKIGLIPISSDESRRPIEIKFLNEVKNFLEKNGFRGEEYKEGEFYDFYVFIVVTGGSEKKFLDIYKKTKPPFLFIANRYNNSLPATLEIIAYLKGEGKVFLWDKKSEKKDFLRILNVLSIKEKIFNKKIGLIGNPSYWLISSTPEFNKVKERFGLNIESYPIEELIERYKKEHDDSKVDEILKELKRKAIELKNINELDLKKAIKLYLLVKKIAQENNFDALSMECFRIINPLDTTGCLALSLLTSENIISGCEGDIPATITMYIMKKIYEKPPFMANIASIEREGDKTTDIVLAHCTVPISLVNNYLFTTHFETGKGVGIKGFFNKDVGTLVRIGGENLDKIFYARAKIIDNLKEDYMCRTQIKLKVNAKRDYFLENPLGNHHIFVLGDYTEELDILSKIFNLSFHFPSEKG